MTSPNDKRWLQDPDTTGQTESPKCISPDPNGPNATLDTASSSKVAFAELDNVSPPHPANEVRDQVQIGDSDKSSKQFRASTHRRRLSGRPSIERMGLAAKPALVSTPSIPSVLSDDPGLSKASSKHRKAYERLAKQVSAWLQQEKTRRATRRAKRTASKEPNRREAQHAAPDHTDGPPVHHERRGSETSEGSVALENLANILERTLSLKSNESSHRKRRPSLVQGNKLSSMMKRQSVVSSDTDYFDGAEDLVPSCEAILDNSKTMAYSGGGAETVEEGGDATKQSRNLRKEKEREAWAAFKYEIVRITHTLRLKGWRRVPLNQSNEIEVERLSGALTNAVYVVSPPKNIRTPADKKSSLPTPKNPPPKLLLRVYGPQVEHLIDREAELQILRRLARKRIGPRLLGTFINGRFEEYFHAQTLTFHDLRVPETSKQIAKRMRELHEGIELLRSEREGGPFVWRNWDKWVDRCEQVVTWLDQQVIESKSKTTLAPSEAWKKRGFVCGVEWPKFRKTIEQYRKWLEDHYGGMHNINERLVFAHNDAQYGNILRLMPAGESPLLLPANEHKQLVVIDFEYANGNLPGLEFANHFTEWCYNYHGEVPHACMTKYYPTPEEQHRFIRAYLTHNPSYRFSPSGPSGSTSAPSNPPTPRLGPIPSTGSTTALAATAAPSSISAFMLDSRAPPGEKYNYQEQEAQAEQKTEKEAKRLMAETKLWRLANSAQWTAWGIVQAVIPGLPDFDKESEDEGNKDDQTETQKGEDIDAETGVGTADHDQEHPAESHEEEFDYLAYAQERAMFVWGDAVQLGIVKLEELPEGLRGKLKIVEH